MYTKPTLRELVNRDGAMGLHLLVHFLEILSLAVVYQFESFGSLKRRCRQCSFSFTAPTMKAEDDIFLN